MSFIANTAFEARITNNENDILANITGKYYASDAAADCSAGLLCVRDERLPCEGFTGVTNENAWKMTAAASTATVDDAIYACNPYETQLLANGNRQYYIGSETLGLGLPSGRHGVFTRVIFDGAHTYRFGAGNLSAAISTNTYFTIADGLLVPAAAKPATAGAVYFELAGSGNFIEGAGKSFGYYDAVACKVTA